MPLNALSVLTVTILVLENASCAVQYSPTASSAAVLQLAPAAHEDTRSPPLVHAHQGLTAPPRIATLARPTAPLFVPLAPLDSPSTPIPFAM